MKTRRLLRTVTATTVAVCGFGVPVVLGGDSCGTFPERVWYSLGNEAYSVAVGDLDGDLDLDLAVANYRYGHFVSVLLNNGDATFAPPVSYGTGAGPHSVAVGDLDGDLDLDMAVANWMSDNVSVLLNDGDGTFAPQVLYSAGDAPYCVAMANLDGNVGLDLAVANGDGDSVSVLLNNGDGTFAPHVLYGAGDAPRSVAVGDLDGDLDLDLAVANFGSDNVSVLPGLGDGTFAPQVLHSAGDGPHAVAVGDLDGDLDLDLAVAIWHGDKVSVLLNDGGGTFAPQVLYDADNAPASVALGDLDGDLDLDLITANHFSDKVSVLLNDGDGTFSPHGLYAAGHRPSSVAVGDLDGDFDLDLAVAEKSGWKVSVMLNQDTVPPELGGAIARAGPESLSHPGGGGLTYAKYFLQPGSTWQGDLVLGTGLDYSVRLEGIDISGFPGGTLVRVGLQESVGSRMFGVQAQLDFYGSGGHLLQSFEYPPAFSVPPDSSHGFDPGDVPGELDLRFDFSQSHAAYPWEITPYYRLEGESDWSLFHDVAVNGPWTTTLGYDITEGLVLVFLSGPNAGTVSFDTLSVIWMHTPGCPADITVNADAGGCTADVAVGMAVAIDNCDSDPLVTGTRSDLLALTDPYPTGVTVITWTATDEAGNSSECFQAVTVNPVNELVVDVGYYGGVAVGPIQRCITFELWERGCGGSSVEVSKTIEFSAGSASGVVVEVPCGDYTCITARDPLHTLRRTDDDTGDFVISGPQYVADFTTGGTSDNRLIAGNLNGDGYIDILDFGVFVGRFGTAPGADTPCGTSGPHADIDGDGNVGIEDYTFIFAGFLAQSEANCCGLPMVMSALSEVDPGRDEGPVTRISVTELRRRGLHDLTAADLNEDGWLDMRDLAAFIGGDGP